MAMLYRPLDEPDLAAHAWIERYAFNAHLDPAQLSPHKLGQLRGLFDDRRLLAQLELLPLRMQTGLGEIATGGLGSVASVPEHRRSGLIERLLRHAVDELRSSGTALCILYPFKQSFYGRYGWATCVERREYSGPPALFAHFKPAPGAFVRVGPEQSDELDQIYRGALRARFGPLVRDAAWWQRELLHDWQRRPRYAYIWRDEAGRGRSYAIFNLEGERTNRQFVAREMVALDPLARAQLFAFIAGHQDQVALVRFPAPADAPVNLLFPDPLDCSIQPLFMLRLLDLPAAMAGYSFPREVSGHLTLALSDDWLSENQGVFGFTFEAGRCEVTRLTDTTQANLSCDIRVFTQIYSRYLRPRTAAAFGLLAAPDRAALTLLERAFSGLVPFNTDYF